MNKLFTLIILLFVVTACDKEEETAISESATIDKIYQVQSSTYVQSTFSKILCKSTPQRGVCWSTNHNPTISDMKTSSAACDGGSQEEIPGLASKTTYYFRAYVLSTNADGIVYSPEVAYKTN